MIKTPYRPYWKDCLKSLRGWSLILVGATLLAGCATNPQQEKGSNISNASEGDSWEEGTNDPLEPYNRWMHSFNMTADEYLIRPLAVAYQEHIPAGIREPTGNFLKNLREPFYAANYYLQGDAEQGTYTLLRFFINSTVGILGLFDIADATGISRESTDLGLTFGHWGAPEGPYLVLPILGPSTLRDGSGLAIQYVTSDYHNVYHWANIETEYQYAATGLYGLHLRVDLLSLDELMKQSGADTYIFMRESYLQNRRESLTEDEWGEWDNTDWE